MNCGKVFWFTRPVRTSTKATVAFLSASGNAANTGSIAPGPRSLSFAIVFCVAGLVGSVADLISVTRRSARKFVKKLIQPLGWCSADQAGGLAADGLAPLSSGIPLATVGLCHSLWFGQTFGLVSRNLPGRSSSGRFNPRVQTLYSLQSRVLRHQLQHA